MNTGPYGHTRSFELLPSQHFSFQFAAVYEWREHDSGGAIRTGLGDEAIVIWGGISIGRRFWFP